MTIRCHLLTSYKAGVCGSYLPTAGIITAHSASEQPVEGVLAVCCCRVSGCYGRLVPALLML